jgi:HAD superfamily phosphoserine phosphatase-like hydrolase
MEFDGIGWFAVTLKRTTMSSDGHRLIVFDVEGVIVPKERHLALQAYRRFGVYGLVLAGVIGALYVVGVLTIKEALSKIYALFRGVSLEDLLRVFRDVPVVHGAVDVFHALKKAGYKTALISSGLPTFLVRDLAERLGADHAVGLELEINAGLLTGRIGGEALEPDGKATLLQSLLIQEDAVSAYMVVADDRNNLPMFPLCQVRMGCNPDVVVRLKCDHVVLNLTEVLAFLQVERPGPNPSSANEKIREAIHMSGFLIPLACFYLGFDCSLLAALLLLVASLYAVTELSRLRGKSIPGFSTVTRVAAIGTELTGFAAAPIYLALGIAVTLLTIPPPVSYASIAILTLGDASASIFGRAFGNHRYFFNKAKTVEGSICGLLLSFLGAALFTHPVQAVIGAAVGMIIEVIPLPVNDNLTISLIAGLAMLLVNGL